MEFGGVTFLAPLALLGLLSLPIIYWILRVTPPSPRKETFPPLRILRDVTTDEETPNSTPFWLLLFRLLLAALIAIALAQPFLQSTEQTENRDLVLVIDNGWAAGDNWTTLQNEAEARITKARRANLRVMLIPTASSARSTETAPQFTPAQSAIDALDVMQPEAMPANRAAAAKAIANIDIRAADAVWLSDGLDTPGSAALSEVLSSAARASVLMPNTENSVLAPGGISEAEAGFRSFWERVDTSGLRTETILAHGKDGRVLGRADVNFAPGERSAEAIFELPTELRNAVSWVQAEGVTSAGSVRLLDDSWGRPLVGILRGADDNRQPLLSETYYVEKALAPYADIFKGTPETVLPLAPSILVMADSARTESDDLTQFVENGGLLLRFAGPRLAARSDALIPVDMRRGGRSLGGALAWEEPQMLAPFEDNSPFFGLVVNDEVTIAKQVMAEAGAETDQRTWARLEDGSPLVTAKPLGTGQIVLFHVTANTEWSNLAVSGLYVDMLRRILPLARTQPNRDIESTGDWRPERVLDGYGRLTTPPVTAQSLADEAILTAEIDAAHPPGLYRQGSRRTALNAVRDASALQRLEAEGLETGRYSTSQPRSIAGLLLTIAAIMVAIDALLALSASGRFGRIKSRFVGTAAAAMMAMLILLPASGMAQDTPNPALDLHLAFVVTGDGRVDRASEQGLAGLTEELTRRTTIEPAEPVGLNLESDNILLYPFLYWPVQRSQPELSEAVAAKLNAYMAAGGTLILDTQDADQQALRPDAHPGLANLVRGLDVPGLTPVPRDHVLNKSFYLLDVYPGRYSEGQVWVDKDQRGTARDGVSSIIVGSNDWSAGWAKDETGRPLYAYDDSMPRQREFAFRFGVNLAMYMLAGNYKSDQVHAKVLIERMGTVPEKDMNRMGEEP